MLFFDPMYFIVLAPALILSIIASIWVKSSFTKWNKRALSSQISGAEAARAILDASGLDRVRIERVAGKLSDHYDPSAKVLRLSAEVHDGRSVASVGVAAHEAGHALQDQHSYKPLLLRTVLVPVASLGSKLTWVLIMAGLFLHMTQLYTAAILLFSAVVLFQLVTLPVEFNASSRAKVALVKFGIVSRDEAIGVNRVLSAAAMTYVAAALTAVLQLVYFILRSRD